MSKLAVVILNWNGKKYLDQFVPIILDRMPEYAELIVADNASTDGSVELMRKRFPEVRIIQNDRNEGFAKGYNVALKQIEAQYYCMLNSDIEVTEHWIEPCIELMDANENVAAVQPKLLSYNHRDEFEYAGAAGGFVDKYGYPFCRGRVFSNVEKDHGQYDTVTDIFWATGAALFVRSEAYHTMGGLDDNFFAHMEEIDFCWRLKNAGYKIKCCPQSVIYHIGGGTLPKQSPFKTYLNFRNNLILLLKNLPEERLNRTFIVKFFLDQMAAFFFLLQGHFKDFTAVYKAMHDFYKNYKVYKINRSTLPKRAFADTYPKSIVFLHYFKGKKFFNGESFS